MSQHKTDDCRKCKAVIRFDTQGAVFCCGCKEWFHNLCARLSLDDLHKFKKKPWFCQDCTAPSSYQNSISIPKTNNKDSSSQKSSGRNCCSDLQLKYDKLQLEFIRIKKRLDSVEKSNGLLSKNLEGEIERLKGEVTRAVTKRPNSQCDIILSNVPELVEENSSAMASVILSAIDDSLPDDAVCSATRFFAKSGPRHLKVTLKTMKLKERMVSMSRKKKLDLRDVNLKSKVKDISAKPDWVDPKGAGHLLAEGKIYVNESVSSKTRALFLAALRLKLDGRISATWTWRNRVYLRLKEDHTPLMCRSESELDRILREAGSLDETGVSNATVA